jgi:hypothetical protein
VGGEREKNEGEQEKNEGEQDTWFDFCIQLIQLTLSSA